MLRLVRSSALAPRQLPLDISRVDGNVSEGWMEALRPACDSPMLSRLVLGCLWPIMVPHLPQATIPSVEPRSLRRLHGVESCKRDLCGSGSDLEQQSVYEQDGYLRCHFQLKPSTIS